jgi:hypothetical protein
VGLYRSEGFVLEGVRRAFVRVRGRPAVDDLVMARFFHEPREERVVALVIRRDRGGPELLVSSRSGVPQVPQGAWEPGEQPFDGVLRVLAATSGLTRVRQLATLAPWDQPQPEADEAGLPALHRLHPFVLEPTSGLPESWEWRVTGGVDEGVLVGNRWEPLGRDVAGFTETLARLRDIVGRRLG